MAEKTVEQLAEEAVRVQDASNLRGVLLAWHRAICSEAVPRGGQIEEFLNVLYLSKVTSLMVADADCIGGVELKPSASRSRPKAVDFRQAYEWAKKTSAGVL